MSIITSNHGLKTHCVCVCMCVCVCVCEFVDMLLKLEL